jgi:soluble lytic murein transglycosylase-like protein
MIDHALVFQVATVYHLPVDLLTAQVQVESGGDPHAFRYEYDFYTRYIRGNPDAKAGQYGPLAACSYGLLQIVLEVAYEIGFDGRPEELFEPRIGLAWGAKKMQALLAWAGTNYVQALAAYNGGTGGNQHPPFRNLAYAEKVYAAAGRSL